MVSRMCRTNSVGLGIGEHRLQLEDGGPVARRGGLARRLRERLRQLRLDKPARAPEIGGLVAERERVGCPRPGDERPRGAERSGPGERDQEPRRILVRLAEAVFLDDRPELGRGYDDDDDGETEWTGGRLLH